MSEPPSFRISTRDEDMIEVSRGRRARRTRAKEGGVRTRAVGAVGVMRKRRDKPDDDESGR
jgi:hypothetical protein